MGERRYAQGRPVPHSLSGLKDMPRQNEPGKSNQYRSKHPYGLYSLPGREYLFDTSQDLSSLIGIVLLIRYRDLSLFGPFLSIHITIPASVWSRGDGMGFRRHDLSCKEIPQWQRPMLWGDYDDHLHCTHLEDTLVFYPDYTITV